LRKFDFEMHAIPAERSDYLNNYDHQPYFELLTSDFELHRAAMLIRTVRMTFRPEAVPEFLAMFEETAPQIRGFAGCRHLELWEDVRFPNILTTYSVWVDEEHLHAYRASPLFTSTWARTRKWFAAPAVAHSYLRKDEG
jgi:quinol monooxygenase YgiN